MYKFQNKVNFRLQGLRQAKLMSMSERDLLTFNMGFGVEIVDF